MVQEACFVGIGQLRLLCLTERFAVRRAGSVVYGFKGRTGAITKNLSGVSGVCRSFVFLSRHSNKKNSMPSEDTKVRLSSALSVLPAYVCLLLSGNYFQSCGNWTCMLFVDAFARSG